MIHYCITAMWKRMTVRMDGRLGDLVRSGMTCAARLAEKTGPAVQRRKQSRREG